jgi:hypothetical protein
MTTWIHFVGGYYTPRGFIMEAKEMGASRKVAPGVARRMAWGDRVIVLKCLDRKNRRALVLGEFEIRRITLPEDVAAEVCADLVAEGRATFLGGGGAIIKRACGSYIDAGSWAVDATVEELMDAVIKVADEKGITPWALVCGPLTKIYHPPWAWEPCPAFHRTFTVTEEDMSFVSDDPRAWIEDVERDPGDRSTVMAVQQYRKRARAQRRDVYEQAAFL